MTDTTTTSLTLAQLAEQRVDLDHRIEALETERARVNDAIRAATDGPDSYAAGPLTVQIQSNSRFDQRKAEQVIPEHLLPLVTVSKSSIDRKKVEVLAPDLLDACITTYDDKVVVK